MKIRKTSYAYGDRAHAPGVIPPAMTAAMALHLPGSKPPAGKHILHHYPGTDSLGGDPTSPDSPELSADIQCREEWIKKK